MTKKSWTSRLTSRERSHSPVERFAFRTALAALLLSCGLSAAQTPAPATPVPATAAQAAAAPAEAPASASVEPTLVVEHGYVVRQTADVGGHMVGVSGSGAMYDTLVNIHTGPRVLGQTLNLTPAPGIKHLLMDSLSAFTTGFGGDPINLAKLDFSKKKVYEFHGTFRRDRQYFDYDLLGNPNIPPGTVIPYGMANGVATTASLAFPSVQQSPVMFNTVRRMTDTSMTFLPLGDISFRLGYAQNIFQGPSTTPSRSIGKNDMLLAEYQRNSTDDFFAALDLKPGQLTKITFEEQVVHYKADSYFTIAPNQFNVQEADGTLAALGNWDAVVTPFTIAACNTASMGSGYTNATNYSILSAPLSPGGRPVINPACDVVTSYLRSQPTRIITPTETLLVQSSSIRHVAFNGNLRYTTANSNLAHYYENWTGLDGAIRNATFNGNAVAQRRMVSTDFGVTWEATKDLTLSDQVDFSNLHQPGYANISPGITQNAPTTAGNETINYAGPLLAGANYSITGNPSGAPLYAYFGQKFLINNATASWSATSLLTLSLTYRYRTHTIVQTSGTGPLSNIISINENGGIFNIAYRPSAQWKMNGTVEVLYDDNAFTPVGPRQTKHYRFHTMYKPKPWATFSGAFNDLERHNNTSNTGTPSLDGPIGHVDHNRTAGVSAVLAPNEQYSFDVSYSYSDIYTSTNICYLSGASVAVPGAASTKGNGTPNLCPDTLTDWGPVKDFMDAPTQYASASINYTPNNKVHTSAGYRISAVSGNQFFANAQQVNGSMQSGYLSPFVNFAWTIHPGLIWRAEYNYYGYGEGGPSGAPFCSTSTSATAVVVPCNSSIITGPTGLKEPSSGLTAPRNMHANVVTLAIHYEF